MKQWTPETMHLLELPKERYTNLAKQITQSVDTVYILNDLALIISQYALSYVIDTFAELEHTNRRIGTYNLSITPTVSERCILKPISEGRNLIYVGPYPNSKNYALAYASRIDPSIKEPQCLVIEPTPESSETTEQRFDQKVQLVDDVTSFWRYVIALHKKQVQVVVGTPRWVGRIIKNAPDIKVEEIHRLKNIKLVVINGYDEMINRGEASTIKELLSELVSNPNIQICIFTGSIPDPIPKLADPILFVQSDH